MDTKTMSFNFGQEDTDKLKEILRRMGEFIAYFEVAENKMVEWKKDIEEAFSQHQQQVSSQLDEITTVTRDLQEIMTETGAARWRIAAEKALHQGQEHLKTIETVSNNHLRLVEEKNSQFVRLAKKSFDRLDRAADHTVKNVNDAVSSFNIAEFKQLTDQSREVVEETSISAIKRIQDVARWFHWKNMGLVAAITLIVSLTMGLYLNDEMPWEIHKQVVTQRNAGQALIDAWPSLSQAEKQRILEHAKKSFRKT